MDKKLAKFTFSSTSTTLIPIIENIIAPLIAVNQEWGFIWTCAISLYSLHLFYEQDKLNEVIEFIKDNPEKFTKNIILNKYFKSNFLKFLRDYLLQENKAKRKALKKILIGTLDKNKKNKYEIDRLNSVLNQISLDAMVCLVWMDKIIIPIMDRDLIKEILKFEKQNDEREKKRIKEVSKMRQSISEYVGRWISENYNPNSKKVKEKYGYKEDWSKENKSEFSHERWLEEHEIEKQKNQFWSEYVSLGIVNSVTKDEGIGGGAGTVYKLTSFGEEFIKYIKP